MVNTEYGCTGLYRDKDGEFDFVEGADWNKCPKCGHIINSERIENAEYIGNCCY